MDIRNKLRIKYLDFDNVGLITLLLLIIVYAIPNNSNAQKNRSSELRKTDVHTHEDYKKAYDLLNLSKEYKESDYRLSLKYAQESHAISTQYNFDNLSVENLFIIAYVTYFYIDRGEALSPFQEGFEIAKKINDYEWKYKYGMELGKWYMYKDHNFEKAREYFLFAIESAEKLNRNEDVARAYAKMAVTYNSDKNTDKIMEIAKLCERYFLKSDNYRLAAHYNCDIGIKLWKYDMEKAVSLYLRAQELDSDNYIVNSSIGEVYSAFNLPEPALRYLKDAHKSHLAQLNENRESAWRGPIIQSEIAFSEFQLENYKAADSIANEIISYFETKERHKKNSYSTAYLIKGRIKEIQGKREEALDYYTKALEIAKIHGISKERISAYLTMGEYHLNNNNTLAKKNCEKALADAEKRDYPNLQVRACDCLHKTSKVEKNYETALAYAERKIEIEESLNQNKASLQLGVFEKLRLKENEKDYEQKLKDEKLKSQGITNLILRVALFIGGILLLLLIRMLSKIRKQNREIKLKNKEIKKTNEHLSQSNEELEKFAYIFSHDLKTPMLIMTQFTNLLREKLGNNVSPIVKESLSHIEKGGERMMKLLQDVLDYTRTKDASVNIEKINLEDLLSEVAGVTKTKYANAVIEIDKPTLENLEWNYVEISILAQNLIDNGILYNKSENPQIWIEGKLSEKYFNLSFRDNGIGIKEEFVENVFGMFKRLHSHSQYEGSGLGLSTCKKIVHSFGGEISLESEEGKGSIFTISFPIEMVVN